MINVPKLQSLRFSLYEYLDHDLDLLSYDGPILSSFRPIDPSDKQVYIKYLVDLDNDTSRWICFPIPENSYINLLLGKVSLNETILEKCSLVFQIEDVYEDKISYSLLKKSDFPLSWLPKKPFFLKKKHYEGQLNHLNAAIDNSWNIDKIKLLINRLGQVHNYIYFMEKSVSGLVSSEAGSGFKGAKIYSDIERSLLESGLKTASMRSIEYASPGVIKIDGKKEILSKLYNAINSFISKSEEIEKIYKDLYKAFLDINERDKKINVSNELKENIHFKSNYIRLCELLPFHDNNADNLKTKDDVDKLLMALSYCRRLKDIKDFLDSKSLDLFI